MKTAKTSIAILGFGTIGQGVADVIRDNADVLREQCGGDVEIAHILDLRDFPEHRLGALVTHDWNDVVNDPDVDVVVEAMGGSHPAFDFSLAALKAGKNVVTSNKEVVANFGDVLLREAKERGLRYLFEASVGGGIPIIRAMTTSLAGNEIVEINGILNGTTNYILTEMKEKGATMAQALAKAQELGYAERDPSADIDGVDAARKICILAALAFGKIASPDSVDVTGIRDMTRDEIVAAEADGEVVKLIAHAEKSASGDLVLSVRPTRLAANSPLASVNGVFNAILVRGRSLGDVMFYGAGAGSLPTASAIVADLVDIIRCGGNQPAQQQWTRV